MLALVAHHLRILRVQSEGHGLGGVLLEDHLADDLQLRSVHKRDAVVDGSPAARRPTRSPPCTSAAQRGPWGRVDVDAFALVVLVQLAEVLGARTAERAAAAGRRQNSTQGRAAAAQTAARTAQQAFFPAAANHRAGQRTAFGQAGIFAFGGVPFGGVPTSPLLTPEEMQAMMCARMDAATAVPAVAATPTAAAATAAMPQAGS